MDWLRAPALYDAILVLLAVEGVVLARAASRIGRRFGPRLASFLAAGAGFTLALRAVAAGWPSWTIALALSMAFLAHLVHLRALARPD